MGKTNNKKNVKTNNKVYLTISIVVVIIILGIGWFTLNMSKQAGKTTPPTPVSNISNFEECKKAGYPIMESYPQQCRVPGGKTFTEEVANEQEKVENITVNSPLPGEIITSPLKIEGEARGTWFFEGSFPIRMVDENGAELGRSFATAQGEWMTENFVPFSAEISFDAASNTEGILILEKDNPSGLPENADELKVPVNFGR